MANNINIYIANVGQYNEGKLVGRWVSLPMSADELSSVLHDDVLIGVENGTGGVYEEYFVPDFMGDEGILSIGLNVGEYTPVEDLNILAGVIVNLDGSQLDAVRVAGNRLNVSSDPLALANLAAQVEDIGWFKYTGDGDNTYEQFAHSIIEGDVLEELGIDDAEQYFDYEAYGRNIRIGDGLRIGDYGFIETDDLPDPLYYSEDEIDQSFINEISTYGDNVTIDDAVVAAQKYFGLSDVQVDAVQLAANYFGTSYATPAQMVGNFAMQVGDIPYFEFLDNVENADTNIGEIYIGMLGDFSLVDEDTIEQYFDYEAYGRDMSFGFVLDDNGFLDTTSDMPSVDYFDRDELVGIAENNLGVDGYYTLSTDAPLQNIFGFEKGASAQQEPVHFGHATVAELRDALLKTGVQEYEADEVIDDIANVNRMFTIGSDAARVELERTEIFDPKDIRALVDFDKIDRLLNTARENGNTEKIEGLVEQRNSFVQTYVIERMGAGDAFYNRITHEIVIPSIGENGELVGFERASVVLPSEEFLTEHCGENDSLADIDGLTKEILVGNSDFEDISVDERGSLISQVALDIASEIGWGNDSVRRVVWGMQDRRTQMQIEALVEHRDFEIGDKVSYDGHSWTVDRIYASGGDRRIELSRETDNIVTPVVGKNVFYDEFCERATLIQVADKPDGADEQQLGLNNADESNTESLTYHGEDVSVEILNLYTGGGIAERRQLELVLYGTGHRRVASVENLGGMVAPLEQFEVATDNRELIDWLVLDSHIGVLSEKQVGFGGIDYPVIYIKPDRLAKLDESGYRNYLRLNNIIEGSTRLTLGANDFNRIADTQVRLDELDVEINKIAGYDTDENIGYRIALSTAGDSNRFEFNVVVDRNTAVDRNFVLRYAVEHAVRSTSYDILRDGRRIADALANWVVTEGGIDPYMFAAALEILPENSDSAKAYFGELFVDADNSRQSTLVAFNSENERGEWVGLYHDLDVAHDISEQTAIEKYSQRGVDIARWETAQNVSIWDGHVYPTFAEFLANTDHEVTDNKFIGHETRAYNIVNTQLNFNVSAFHRWEDGKSNSVNIDLPMGENELEEILGDNTEHRLNRRLDDWGVGDFKNTTFDQIGVGRIIETSLLQPIYDLGVDVFALNQLALFVQKVNPTIDQIKAVGQSVMRLDYVSVDEIIETLYEAALDGLHDQISGVIADTHRTAGEKSEQIAHLVETEVDVNKAYLEACIWFDRSLYNTETGEFVRVVTDEDSKTKLLVDTIGIQQAINYLNNDSSLVLVDADQETIGELPLATSLTAWAQDEGNKEYEKRVRNVSADEITVWIDTQARKSGWGNDSGSRILSAYNSEMQAQENEKLAHEISGIPQFNLSANDPKDEKDTNFESIALRFPRLAEQRRQMTEDIVEKMRSGEFGAWEQTWSSVSAPFNPLTGTQYHGSNRLNLSIIAAINAYDDPRWVTKAGAEKQGWSIKDGEENNFACVEHWRAIPHFELDENGERIVDEDGNFKIDNYYLRLNNYFRVYNASLIEGIEPWVAPVNENSDESLNIVADRLIESSRCTVFEHQQDSPPNYMPTLDQINMPLRQQYETNQSFVNNLLHEMAHSTGHTSALSREMSQERQSYAHEELIAELSCVFSCGELGLSAEITPDNPQFDNHVAYLSGWANAISHDPNILYEAVSAADAATSYIIDRYDNVLSARGENRSFAQSLEAAKEVQQNREKAASNGDIEVSKKQIRGQKIDTETGEYIGCYLDDKDCVPFENHKNGSKYWRVVVPSGTVFGGEVGSAITEPESAAISIDNVDIPDTGNTVVVHIPEHMRFVRDGSRSRRRHVTGDEFKQIQEKINNSYSNDELVFENSVTTIGSTSSGSLLNFRPITEKDIDTNFLTIDERNRFIDRTSLGQMLVHEGRVIVCDRGIILRDVSQTWLPQLDKFETFAPSDDRTSVNFGLPENTFDEVLDNIDPFYESLYRRNVTGMQPSDWALFLADVARDAASAFNMDFYQTDAFRAVLHSFSARDLNPVAIGNIAAQINDIPYQPYMIHDTGDSITVGDAWVNWHIRFSPSATIPDDVFEKYFDTQAYLAYANEQQRQNVARILNNSGIVNAEAVSYAPADSLSNIGSNGVFLHDQKIIFAQNEVTLAPATKEGINGGTVARVKISLPQRSAELELRLSEYFESRRDALVVDVDTMSMLGQVGLKHIIENSGNGGISWEEVNVLAARLATLSYENIVELSSFSQLQNYNISPLELVAVANLIESGEDVFADTFNLGMVDTEEYRESALRVAEQLGISDYFETPLLSVPIESVVGQDDVTIGSVNCEPFIGNDNSKRFYKIEFFDGAEATYLGRSVDLSGHVGIIENVDIEDMSENTVTARPFGRIPVEVDEATGEDTQMLFDVAEVRSVFDNYADHVPDAAEEDTINNTVGLTPSNNFDTRINHLSVPVPTYENGVPAFGNRSVWYAELCPGGVQNDRTEQNTLFAFTDERSRDMWVDHTNSDLSEAIEYNTDHESTESPDFAIALSAEEATEIYGQYGAARAGLLTLENINSARRAGIGIVAYLQNEFPTSELVNYGLYGLDNTENLGSEKMPQAEYLDRWAVAYNDHNWIIEEILANSETGAPTNVRLGRIDSANNEHIENIVAYEEFIDGASLLSNGSDIARESIDDTFSAGQVFYRNAYRHEIIMPIPFNSEQMRVIESEELLNPNNSADIVEAVNNGEYNDENITVIDRNSAYNRILWETGWTSEGDFGVEVVADSEIALSFPLDTRTHEEFVEAFKEATGGLDPDAAEFDLSTRGSWEILGIRNNGNVEELNALAMAASPLAYGQRALLANAAEIERGVIDPIQMTNFLMYGTEIRIDSVQLVDARNYKQIPLDMLDGDIDDLNRLTNNHMHYVFTDNGTLRPTYESNMLRAGIDYSLGELLEEIDDWNEEHGLTSSTYNTAREAIYALQYGNVNQWNDALGYVQDNHFTLGAQLYVATRDYAESLVTVDLPLASVQDEFYRKRDIERVKEHLQNGQNFYNVYSGEVTHRLETGDIALFEISDTYGSNAIERRLALGSNELFSEFEADHTGVIRTVGVDELSEQIAEDSRSLWGGWGDDSFERYAQQRVENAQYEKTIEVRPEQVRGYRRRYNDEVAVNVEGCLPYDSLWNDRINAFGNVKSYLYAVPAGAVFQYSPAQENGEYICNIPADRVQINDAGQVFLNLPRETTLRYRGTNKLNDLNVASYPALPASAEYLETVQNYYDEHDMYNISRADVEREYITTVDAPYEGDIITTEISIDNNVTTGELSLYATDHAGDINGEIIAERTIAHSPIALEPFVAAEIYYEPERGAYLYPSEDAYYIRSLSERIGAIDDHGLYTSLLRFDPARLKQLDPVGYERYLEINNIEDPTLDGNNGILNSHVQKLSNADVISRIKHIDLHVDPLDSNYYDDEFSNPYGLYDYRFLIGSEEVEVKLHTSPTLHPTDENRSIIAISEYFDSLALYQNAYEIMQSRGSDDRAAFGVPDNFDKHIAFVEKAGIQPYEIGDVAWALVHSQDVRNFYMNKNDYPEYDDVLGEFRGRELDRLYEGILSENSSSSDREFYTSGYLEAKITYGESFYNVKTGQFVQVSNNRKNPVLHVYQIPLESAAYVLGNTQGSHIGTLLDGQHVVVPNSDTEKEYASLDEWAAENLGSGASGEETILDVASFVNTQSKQSGWGGIEKDEIDRAARQADAENKLGLTSYYNSEANVLILPDCRSARPVYLTLSHNLDGSVCAFDLDAYLADGNSIDFKDSSSLMTWAVFDSGLRSPKSKSLQKYIEVMPREKAALRIATESGWGIDSVERFENRQQKIGAIADDDRSQNLADEIHEKFGDVKFEISHIGSIEAGLREYTIKATCPNEAEIEFDILRTPGGSSAVAVEELLENNADLRSFVSDQFDINEKTRQTYFEYVQNNPETVDALFNGGQRSPSLVGVYDIGLGIDTADLLCSDNVYNAATLSDLKVDGVAGLHGIGGDRVGVISLALEDAGFGTLEKSYEVADSQTEINGENKIGCVVVPKIFLNDISDADFDKTRKAIDDAINNEDISNSLPLGREEEFVQISEVGNIVSDIKEGRAVNILDAGTLLEQIPGVDDKLIGALYDTYGALSRIVCLDLETTGLTAGSDEVLSIAMYDGNGEELFNQLVKPEHTESWPGAEKFNHISWDDVKDKHTIDYWHNDIERCLNQASVLVGFNIDRFDAQFITAAGFDIKDKKTLDVMVDFRDYCSSDRHNPNLEACSAHYGYKFDWHVAANDVKATLHCAMSMLDDPTYLENKADETAFDIAVADTIRHNQELETVQEGVFCREDDGEFCTFVSAADPERGNVSYRQDFKIVDGNIEVAGLQSPNEFTHSDFHKFGYKDITNSDIGQAVIEHEKNWSLFLNDTAAVKEEICVGAVRATEMLENENRSVYNVVTRTLIVPNGSDFLVYDLSGVSKKVIEDTGGLVNFADQKLSAKLTFPKDGTENLRNLILRYGISGWGDATYSRIKDWDKILDSAKDKPLSLSDADVYTTSFDPKSNQYWLQRYEDNKRAQKLPTSLSDTGEVKLGKEVGYVLAVRSCDGSTYAVLAPDKSVTFNEGHVSLAPDVGETVNAIKYDHLLSVYSLHEPGAQICTVSINELKNIACENSALNEFSALQRAPTNTRDGVIASVGNKLDDRSLAGVSSHLATAQVAAQELSKNQVRPSPQEVALTNGVGRGAT